MYTCYTQLYHHKRKTTPHHGHMAGPASSHVSKQQASTSKQRAPEHAAQHTAQGLHSQSHQTEHPHQVAITQAVDNSHDHNAKSSLTHEQTASSSSKGCDDSNQSPSCAGPMSEVH